MRMPHTQTCNVRSVHSVSCLNCRLHSCRAPEYCRCQRRAPEILQMPAQKENEARAHPTQTTGATGAHGRSPPGPERAAPHAGPAVPAAVAIEQQARAAYLAAAARAMLQIACWLVCGLPFGMCSSKEWRYDGVGFANGGLRCLVQHTHLEARADQGKNPNPPMRTVCVQCMPLRPSTAWLRRRCVLQTTPDCTGLG